MPSKPRQFSYQERPIWFEPSFLDELLDNYLEKKGQNHKSTGPLPALEMVRRLLSGILTDKDTAWVEALAPKDRILLTRCDQMLEAAAKMYPNIPVGKESDEQMHAFLDKLTIRLQKLATGDMMLIPVGWRREKRRDPVWAMSVVQRTGMKNFSISIINTNVQEGLGYHDISANNPSGTSYKLALQLENCSEKRITTSPFWLMVFRELCYPNQSRPPPPSGVPAPQAGATARQANELGEDELTSQPTKGGCALFYDTLLPFLNSTPLLTNHCLREGKGVWTQLPSAGDTSMFGCVKHCILHALHCMDMPMHAVDYVELLLRREFLSMAEHDLGELDSISGSEAKLLEIAGKEVAQTCSNFALDASAENTLYKTSQLSSLLRLLGRINSTGSSKVGNGSGELDKVLSLRVPSPNPASFKPSPLFCELASSDVDVEKLAGQAPPPPIQRPVQLTLVPETVDSFQEVAVALRHAENVCTLLTFQREVKNRVLMTVALLQDVFTNVLPVPLPYSHPSRTLPVERGGCIWAQPMPYAYQHDILKSVAALCRHFVAASFSLPHSRSSDSTRVLTLGCMTAVMDALLRTPASDVPSRFSFFLDGKAPGPSFPFGFDVGNFEVLSEAALYTEPLLITTRTQLLDYFTALRLRLRPDHVLFSFEHSSAMGKGEQRLIDSLCWDVGFDASPNVLPHYLTGQRPVLMDFFPELLHYRNTVFFFKFCMTDVSNLPQLDVKHAADRAAEMGLLGAEAHGTAWSYAAARLSWRYDPKAALLSVKAFGMEMKCTGQERAKQALLERERLKDGASAYEDVVVTKKRGFFRKTKTVVITKEVGEARGDPSPADPSYLCGQRIQDEEDVLHAKKLPTFENRISKQNSELLMSYLTVPYMRIPLVLSFFAKEENLLTLKHKGLRELVDAAVFEPGYWDAGSNPPLPTTLPFTDRQLLQTSCGLLFNELKVNSSSATLTHLQTMVDLAVDLDTFKHNEKSSDVIFYVLRLAVRVEGFMLDLICRNKREELRGQVRGLRAVDVVVARLEEARERLRAALDGQMLPIIERWCAQATEQGQLPLACICHAHLIFLHKNATFEDLDSKTVTALLCSQTFLSSRALFHSRFTKYLMESDLEKARKDAKFADAITTPPEVGSHIPDGELFSIFQKNRHLILKWLKQHPEMANKVMEAVVRVVTFTGTKDGVDPDLAVVLAVDRRWESMQEQDCDGRFFPDTGGGRGKEGDDKKPMYSEEDKAKYFFFKSQLEGYEDFLRRRQENITAETEINVQYGVYAVKTARLKLLDATIQRMADFTHLLGPPRQIQCASLKATQVVHAVRLVGRRVDLAYWRPCDPSLPEATPPLPFQRPYTPDLSSTEQWVCDVLEPYRISHMKEWYFYLPEAKLSPEAHVAHMIGYKVIQLPSKATRLQSVKDELQAGVAGEEEGKSKKKKKGEEEKNEAPVMVPYKLVKEVVVFKEQQAVHVYNIVQHGRKFYRTLIYSSDPCFCLHDLAPSMVVQHNKEAPWNESFSPSYEGGQCDVPNKPTTSLVISRNLSATLGLQTYIPPRHMHGIVPATLLEQYAFWQNSEGSITGYPLSCNLAGLHKLAGGNLASDARKEEEQADEEDASVTAARLAAQAVPSHTIEVTFTDAHVGLFGVGGPQGHAIIRRLPYIGPVGGPNDASGVGGGPSGDTQYQKPLLLLNLLYAKQATPLGELRSVLVRVENLSHVLCWTQCPDLTLPGSQGDEGKEGGEEGGACRVDLVELPRLRLSFSSAGSSATSPKLYSVEHAGHYLAGHRAGDIAGLLAGIPQSLVLQHVEGSISILIPSGSLPSRPLLRTSLFPAEVVFDRRNKRWLATRTVRHYMYKVHSSLAFIMGGNLASTLYLLLLRFLHRQYTEAFKLADLCHSDGKLSEEERQVLSQLDFLGSRHDSHPDAGACRLKLSLVCMDSSQIKLPWRVGPELVAYLKKLGSVSGACRLSHDEELALLESVDQAIINESFALNNRWEYLKAAKTGTPFAPVVLPSRSGDAAAWDGTEDRSCSAGEQYLKNIKAPSYSRPQELSGPEAVAQLNKWIKEGFELSHNKGRLGWLFYYELLTESLNFRMCGNDQSHELGCLLLRLLPPEVYSAKSMQMSLLRLLATNRMLGPGGAAPTYKDNRMVKSSLFKGGFPKFLKDLHSFVVSSLKKAEEVKWPSKPNDFAFYEIPFKVDVKETAVGVENWREVEAERRKDKGGEEEGKEKEAECQDSSHCPLPRVADYKASSRGFGVIGGDDSARGRDAFMTRDDCGAFARFPLKPVGLNEFVTGRSREERGLCTVPSALPFAVDKHPHALSAAGQAHLTRLVKDAAVYGAQENEGQMPRLLHFFEQDVEALVEEPRGEGMTEAVRAVRSLQAQLLALYEEDKEFVQRVSKYVVDVANGKLTSGLDREKEAEEEKEGLEEARTSAKRRRLAYRLATHSSKRASVSLEYIVASLVSTRGAKDLRALQPHLSQATAERILDLTACVMLHNSRAVHAQRCVTLATKLLSLLKRLHNTGEEALSARSAAEKKATSIDVQLKANVLASQLAMKRWFMEKQAGAGVIFDPRMLYFEFAHDILLRQSQVVLVKSFMQTASERGSTCHQMIMGAGKTTVVGPLLALMLADGEQLVVQVCPPALLEFSRGVLTSRFLNIVTKSVHTFRFDRFTPVHENMYSRLIAARTMGSVVVTTPTSLKSVFLKFVEAVHIVDELSNRDIGQLASTGVFGRIFRGGTRKKQLEEQARMQDEMALVKQQQLTKALQCFKILKLFQDSLLMLDEVDMILHPLRSELNWPLGEKLPLDFTRGMGGIAAGQRWEIPFHLIDALFYALSGRLIGLFSQSSQAHGILRRLRAAIHKGLERRVLQRTPHLIVLDRRFYKEELRPLLAEWALLYIQSFQVQRVKEKDLLEYIIHGRRDRSVYEQVDRLGGNYIKMLNLVHDWLSHYFPFVLGKIDRVSFGLLNKQDLKRCLSVDPKMPKSRRLCAVPFTGKDVPSQSSEFSHPDVVLGLTVLAYRYEGLRRTDFDVVMLALREAMEDEQGHYHKRPSCVMFAKWIHLSGGKVRGWSKRMRLEKRQGGSSKGAGADEEEDGELTEATFVETQDQDGNSEHRGDMSDYQDMWPLHLMEFADEAQTDKVYRLLHRLPPLVHFYLTRFVFPETTRHQRLKLSTSGQALGGSLLFGRRFGFSGTANDLLPRELGHCNYEEGTDGKMVYYLTSDTIMTHDFVPPNWSVESLLHRVANANPPLHALIDTGALITGMTNLQVARSLLTLGLPSMKGVIFLDAKDRKMVLPRSTMVPVQMEQCSIDPADRFTFFDQVHTTGMDIPQCLEATAVVTVGKDMTFRDYAQGAFRMRGIGAGQTIKLYMIPEVTRLVREAAAIAAQGGGAGSALPDDNEPYIKECRQDAKRLLVDVSAYLVINSMRMEKLQYNVLLEQNVRNVWRKRVANHLLNKYKGVGSKGSDLGRNVDVFRERVDYSVDNSVPERASFLKRLQEEIDANHGFATEAEDVEHIKTFRRAVMETEATDRQLALAASLDKDRAFSSEQAAPLKYSREGMDATPWDLETLGGSRLEAKFAAAYSEFAVYREKPKGGKEKEYRPKPINFPEFLLLSKNHYNQAWANAPRRLKNNIVSLEWVPEPDNLKPLLGTYSILKKDQEEVLEKAFGLFNTGSLKGKLQVDEMSALLTALEALVGGETQGEVEALIEEVYTLCLKETEQEAWSQLRQQQQDKKGSLPSPPFELGTVKRMLATNAHGKMQAGRYYVTLSLREAESLRGLLHEREALSQPLTSGDQCFVGLRQVGSALLDVSPGYVPAGAYQSDTAEQCLRFADNQHYYHPRALSLLVRGLQRNACPDRKEWYEGVRRCRLRASEEISQTSTVGRVYTLPDEYATLQDKAVVSAVRSLIAQKGLLLLDAFRAFDYNRDGFLQIEELYGGLTWLGLDLTPKEMRQLFTNCDVDQMNKLAYRDFSRAFRQPSKAKLTKAKAQALLQGLEQEPLQEEKEDSAAEEEPRFTRTRSNAQDAKEEEGDKKEEEQKDDLRSVSILPRPLVEGGEASEAAMRALLGRNEDPQASQRVITEGGEDISIMAWKMIGDKVTIKMKKIKSFEEIWTSQHTNSREKVSVWEPNFSYALTSKKSMTQQVCLGYYACVGFKPPNKTDKNDRFVLEVTKKSGARASLAEIVDYFLPKPLKFTCIWSMEAITVSGKSSSPAYAWLPVPPSAEYEALGYVVTTTPEEPPLDSIRCVPKRWLVPTSPQPACHWTDSGTGGRSASFWSMSSEHMLVVAPGHKKPTGIFYNIWNQKPFKASDGVFPMQ